MPIVQQFFEQELAASRPLTRYTRRLAERVRFQLDYLSWSAHNPDRHPRHTDLELARADQFLMALRWDYVGEQRDEVDAARAAIGHVRDATKHDLLDMKTQRYVVDPRRGPMLKAAKAEHPWIGEALAHAEALLADEWGAQGSTRWPQRAWQRAGYRERARRLKAEIEAGGYVSLEEKMRRAVSTWRKRGLIPPTPPRT